MEVVWCKKPPGRQFATKDYYYDDARNFQQWNEGNAPANLSVGKYIIPQFGFVTPLFEKPKEPQRRVERLYTTRPFFEGFNTDSQPETKTLHNVKVTKALPGKLVILCEGRNRERFYICRTCGTHLTELEGKHKTPAGAECFGALGRFSLGHELVTDVVRMEFPRLTNQWDAYSLAYAILLGAAETMDVPTTDLNVTITGGETRNDTGIVLYDGVPGGAGLVVQLERTNVFDNTLVKARERMQGNCGCDSSCYGCLRSYRNQFAHPHLDRNAALEFLNIALNTA